MYKLLFLVSILLWKTSNDKKIATKHFLKTLQDLKEHNRVFAHAQELDFWAGGQEFKDAGMVI